MKTDDNDKDIEELITPSVRELIMTEGSRLPWQDLVRIFKQPNVTVDEAQCSVHNKACKCATAMVHVAGTPCPAWSMQTRSTKEVARRKDLFHFLAWAAQRRRLQELFIVHENVQHFPIEILETFLSEMYCIHTLMIEAADFAAGSCRLRRWTLMVHKKAVVQ